MTKAWTVDNLDPTGSVNTNTTNIIAVRVAEFYSHAPALDDPDAVDALHQMRIGAKRLRYTLELFEDIFGPIGERQTKRVKQIQEVLGEIHDLDVRIALIRNSLAAVASDHLQELDRALATTEIDEQRSIIASALRPPPDDPQRGLLGLLGRQHAERKKQRAEIDRIWQKF